MDKEGLERSKPEQNIAPQFEVKRIKELVLPQPPRILKKARMQRKTPTGNTDKSLQSEFCCNPSGGSTKQYVSLRAGGYPSLL